MAKKTDADSDITFEDDTITFASEDDIHGLDDAIDMPDDDEFEAEYDFDRMFSDPPGSTDTIDVPDDEEDDELVLVDDDKGDGEPNEYDAMSDEMRQRVEAADSAAAAARQELEESKAETARLKHQQIVERQAYLGTVVANTESRIQAATAEMRAAIENGETDKQVDLQVEIGKLGGQLQQASAAKGQVDAYLTKNPKAPAAPTKAADAGGARANGSTPQAKAWLERNAWFQDAKFQAAASMAASIGQLLDADTRFDNRTPAYFAELDRRLNAGLPAEMLRAMGRPTKGGRPRPDTRGSERTAAVSRSGTTAGKGGKQQSSKTRVVLDDFDRRTMVKFGLDPRDKAHVRHMALAKRGRLAGDKTVHA